MPVRELSVILQLRLACEEQNSFLLLIVCVVPPFLKERLHSSNCDPKPSELSLSLFSPKEGGFERQTEFCL